MWVVGTFRIARNCMPPTQILIRIFSKWPNSREIFCPYWQYEYLDRYLWRYESIHSYCHDDGIIFVVVCCANTSENLSYFQKYLAASTLRGRTKGRPTSQSWEATLEGFLISTDLMTRLIRLFFLSTHKERAPLNQHTFSGSTHNFRCSKGIIRF